jgi:bifunctional non-homologous end joining protein LigD
VVQHHFARREHYDFRLELEGALRSWAVPKGPSLDPSDKRLAVQVEDHPLEYAKFHGRIPEGQYGAGRVLIWDRGQWNPDDADPAAALRKGKLTFTLKGKKLRGGWSLVRIRGRDSSDRVNWLLIKRNDEFARHDGRVEDEHVKSSSGQRAPKRSKATDPAVPRARKASEPNPASLAGAKRLAQTTALHPQLATLVDDVPTGDDWVHEVKFDGYRILATIKNGRVRLITRNQQDWSAKFPETQASLEALGFSSGILDGELVALNPHGVSHFQDLQRALREHRTGSLAYFVFDVPHWGEFDLTRCALRDRQSFLRQIFASIKPKPSRSASSIRLSEAIEGHGGQVYRQACRLGLEGIVSKRADGIYEQKRSRDWLKIRCSNRQEFVIGGFTDPQRTRQGLGALLIGYYNADGDFTYAGKVGTGFDDKTLIDMTKRLKAIEQASSPFVNHIKAPGAKEAHWVKPKVVVEISFTEWTADGRLRHPVFHGIREDKPAREVVRESPRTVRGAKTIAARTSRPKQNPTSQQHTPRHSSRSLDGSDMVEGVKITHPERIVYESDGITKLQVARYYDEVARWMMPHAEDRPLSLVRCPNGASGHCFYQKHPTVERGMRGLTTVPVVESKGRMTYVAAENIDGIIFLVQMNALELHGWGSRADDVESPDRLVIDLDPGESVDWEQVVDGAMRVRELLADIGLESFVKTTGGKGLHVVAPIQRRLDWDTAKAFTRALADRIVADDPEHFIATMSKARRVGKVFVDYLRNQRGATSVLPYSTRAKPGATVSMPVEWNDLKNIRSEMYTVGNATKHIAKRRSDPWKDFARIRQSVTAKALAAVGTT